jgi:hypothetical protein
MSTTKDKEILIFGKSIYEWRTRVKKCDVDEEFFQVCEIMGNKEFASRCITASHETYLNMWNLRQEMLELSRKMDGCLVCRDLEFL